MEIYSTRMIKNYIKILYKEFHILSRRTYNRPEVMREAPDRRIKIQACHDGSNGAVKLQFTDTLNQHIYFTHDVQVLDYMYVLVVII